MAAETTKNVRLGLFVTLGCAVLIVSLYLIGKNQNLFGSSFHIRARFSNINGLMEGNNVRYSGIQAGTVKKITVLNDTTIEVHLLINKKMQPYIHQNSFASIGSEGLMGNKVINITPNKAPAPMVNENDLLLTKKSTSTDEMMETLSGTNLNAAVISENLKDMLDHINRSKALWAILDDSTLGPTVHGSVNNIGRASGRVNDLVASLNAMASDVRNGKGAAGAILSDPALAANLRNAVDNINHAGREAQTVITRVDSIAASVHSDINSGSGPAHAMLKDTAMVGQLSRSLDHIERGTASFEQNMEALKHNVLTRGYFRRQAKHQSRAAK
jgi:phospholipid/cholesterol/gamma-HCH transport system substrate-binding protein